MFVNALHTFVEMDLVSLYLRTYKQLFTIVSKDDY